MSDRWRSIRVGSIDAGENETRLDMDDEEIADLAVSIGRIGMINPMVVRAKGDRFVIIAGHRRFEAAKRCGCGSVPCHVEYSENPQRKEIAIAENLFRADLSAVETACMIKDLVDNEVMDVAAVAKAMHRSAHWVVAQLDLLCWPDDILAAVHGRKLSVSAASNLAVVTDDTYRNFLLRNAVDSGASARTTAAWLQAWRASAPAAEAVESEPLAGGTGVNPACPQAPCIACGEVKRTDALATVLMCPLCVGAVRNAGAG